MQKKIKSNFFSSPCFSETCESWIIILYLPPGKQSVWVWALILSVTAKQCCKMSETDQKKDPPIKYGMVSVFERRKMNKKR